MKRLWKNLRDTYVRKKREEGEVRSGQAGGKKKTWKYMEAMSFLELPTSFRRYMNTCKFLLQSKILFVLCYVVKI